MASDPKLLDAFRRQCMTAIRPKRKYGLLDQDAAYLVFLGWLGQDGVTRDDLIDIVKEIANDPDPLRNCWPKPPRLSPEQEMTGDQPPEEDKLTEYIVIRDPLALLPSRWHGLWIYRQEPSPSIERIAELPGARLTAAATGRFERRGDGALAEVYEVGPSR